MGQGDRGGVRRWVWMAGLALLVPVTMAGPAGAQRARRTAATPTPPPVTGTDCEEHQAWVEGDPAAVAARLPGQYRAITLPDGKPLVFARAQQCERLVVDGRSSRGIVADYGVVVETPDGGGCGSGIPVIGPVKGDIPPVCNWYTLSLLSNDRRLVDWLRQRTPGVPALHVRDLTFDIAAADPLGRAPFHFETPSSVPSPFTLDDVSGLRPGELSLRGSYWFDTPQGTVKMVISTDDLRGGHADTVVRTPPGSDLAVLMGATERTSVAPYSDFGLIRAGHGVLRKQLLGPSLPGEQLDTFEGSCSLQGTVTFTPPATDFQQDAVYAYDATGTCDGIVNGASVSNAPVTLYQSGHADASCVHAQSFPPGNGAFTFSDGTKLPYTLDFTSKLTELDGTAYGTRSGQASGHATFMTQRSSPDLPLQCATTGASQAPMDMSFSTQRPLVSNRIGQT